MKRLLLDLVKDPILRPQLAFKGGTCLYLFHNLDRFSTDLDFNLLVEDLNVSRVEDVIENTKNLEIRDTKAKFNTYFWSLSYDNTSENIKIEISRRLEYPDTYELQDFYGLKIQTMTKDCMFAHKLCAISDRKIMQNRDLYDSLFMFKNNYSIKEDIIKIRTGKSLKQYLIFLKEYIKKNVNRNKILDGLGEVLDNSKKSYYKQNLIIDFMLEIDLKIDSL